MAEFLRQNWAWMFSFGGFLIGIFVYIYSHIKALQKGVQALLRSQMTAEYYKYKQQRQVPLYVKTNFENLWVQYEKLGKNGVMNNLHSEFMGWDTSIDNGVVHN